MSDPDFEVLLQSPLDDPREPSGIGWYLIGGGAGLVAVVALAWLGGFGMTNRAEPSVTVATPAAAETTTTPVAAAPTETPPYPEGYVDVNGDVGAKPIHVAIAEDSFVVAVSLATRRGVEPAGALRPLGGDWRLDHADGTSSQARRMIADRFHPGVYSVEFAGRPRPNDVLRVTESWEPVAVEQVARVPYVDDAPFVFPPGIGIGLADGVGVAVEGYLARFTGKLSWTFVDSTAAPGVGAVEVALLDSDGEEIGSYAAADPDLNPLRGTDSRQLFWSPGLPVDQTGAVEVLLQAHFQLGAEAPLDAAFDLGDLPVVAWGDE